MVDTPKSLVDLLARIEEYESKTDIPWYRGHGSASYKLRPKIARKGNDAHTFAEVYAVETAMFKEFSARSRPFFPSWSGDQLDTMFNMQHYGVPTRLLDWSASPFVAAFFALMPRGGKHEHDAKIWMCNPVAWNSAFIQPASTQYPILDKSESRGRVALKDYGFGLEIHEYRPEPLMVLGAYNNDRIVAQSGGFTIFGTDFTPLDEVAAANSSIPGEALESITILASDREVIFNSLVKKGFTESFVYPDIEGLAQEMTRKYRLPDA